METVRRLENDRVVLWLRKNHSGMETEADRL